MAASLSSQVEVSVLTQLFLMREDVEEAINLLESFSKNSPQHNTQVIPPLFSAIAGLRQAQVRAKKGMEHALELSVRAAREESCH